MHLSQEIPGHHNEKRMTSFDEFSRTTTEPASLLRKVVTYVMAAGLIVLALMFSALLFAIVLTVGTVIGAYLWWKTRGLRKQMREHPMEHSVVMNGVIIEDGVIVDDVVKGEIIEGEVIREINYRDRNEH